MLLLLLLLLLLTLRGSCVVVAPTTAQAEEHRSQLLLARVETAEEGVAKQQDSDVAKLEQEKRDLMAELAHMATTLKRERAKAIEIDKLQRSFLSMQQQQDDRLSEIKRTDLAIIQEVCYAGWCEIVRCVWSMVVMFVHCCCVRVCANQWRTSTWLRRMGMMA